MQLIEDAFPKYTPSPWQVRYWGYEGKPLSGIRIADVTNGCHLCKIYPSVDEYTDEFYYERKIEFSEEDHANASLIAAAPTLMEVVVEYLASGAGTPELQEKALEAITIACPYMFKNS